MFAFAPGERGGPLTQPQPPFQFGRLAASNAVYPPLSSSQLRPVSLPPKMHGPTSAAPAAAANREASPELDQLDITRTRGDEGSALNYDPADVQIPQRLIDAASTAPEPPQPGQIGHQSGSMPPALPSFSLIGGAALVGGGGRGAVPFEPSRKLFPLNQSLINHSTATISPLVTADGGHLVGVGNSIGNMNAEQPRRGREWTQAQPLKRPSANFIGDHAGGNANVRNGNGDQNLLVEKDDSIFASILRQPVEGAGEECNNGNASMMSRTGTFSSVANGVRLLEPVRLQPSRFTSPQPFSSQPKLVVPRSLSVGVVRPSGSGVPAGGTTNGVEYGKEAGGAGAVESENERSSPANARKSQSGKRTGRSSWKLNLGNSWIANMNLPKIGMGNASSSTGRGSTNNLTTNVNNRKSATQSLRPSLCQNGDVLGSQQVDGGNYGSAGGGANDVVVDVIPTVVAKPGPAGRDGGGHNKSASPTTCEEGATSGHVAGGGQDSGQVGDTTSVEESNSQSFGAVQPPGQQLWSLGSFGARLGAGTTRGIMGVNNFGWGRPQPQAQFLDERKASSLGPYGGAWNCPGVSSTWQLPVRGLAIGADARGSSGGAAAGAGTAGDVPGQIGMQPTAGEIMPSATTTAAGTASEGGPRSFLKPRTARAGMMNGQNTALSTARKKLLSGSPKTARLKDVARMRLEERSQSPVACSPLTVVQPAALDGRSFDLLRKDYKELQAKHRRVLDRMSKLTHAFATAQEKAGALERQNKILQTTVDRQKDLLMRERAKNLALRARGVTAPATRNASSDTAHARKPGPGAKLKTRSAVGPPSSAVSANRVRSPSAAGSDKDAGGRASPMVPPVSARLRSRDAVDGSRGPEFAAESHPACLAQVVEAEEQDGQASGPERWNAESGAAQAHTQSKPAEARGRDLPRSPEPGELSSNTIANGNAHANYDETHQEDAGSGSQQRSTSAMDEDGNMALALRLQAQMQRALEKSRSSPARFVHEHANTSTTEDPTRLLGASTAQSRTSRGAGTTTQSSGSSSSSSSATSKSAASSAAYTCKDAAAGETSLSMRGTKRNEAQFQTASAQSSSVNASKSNSHSKTSSASSSSGSSSSYHSSAYSVKSGSQSSKGSSHPLRESEGRGAAESTGKGAGLLASARVPTANLPPMHQPRAPPSEAHHQDSSHMSGEGDERSQAPPEPTPQEDFPSSAPPAAPSKDPELPLEHSKPAHAQPAPFLPSRSGGPPTANYYATAPPGPQQLQGDPPGSTFRGNVNMMTMGGTKTTSTAYNDNHYNDQRPVNLLKGVSPSYSQLFDKGNLIIPADSDSIFPEDSASNACYRPSPIESEHGGGLGKRALGPATLAQKGVGGSKLPRWPPREPPKDDEQRFPVTPPFLKTLGKT